MSDDGGNKFLSGLILGAVIGLAIGIFNAPRSGEESRKIAKEKLAELGKHIKHESGSSSD
ncbi:MAG: YtxH domain-containing protein [Dehalococcoidia bacterium]|nr:YtxH domain-containing protein [Dehalococcoidia bacterium]